jgi:hypothetical protein
METYTQKDFEKKVKLEDLEVFTSKELKDFAENSMNEISKSEGSKDELMKSVADEIRTFKPVMIYSDTLEKSIKFIRPSQVEWDTVEGDNIQKSRSGVYKNTPENKKLGRIGQKYGGKKENDEGEDEKGNYGLLDKETGNYSYFDSYENAAKAAAKYYPNDTRKQYYDIEVKNNKNKDGDKSIEVESTLKIGSPVKIPNNLTTDPKNKQGSSGKVIKIEDKIATVKFEDGVEGNYDIDIFDNK